MARITILLLLAIGAAVALPALTSSGCSAAQRTAIKHDLWDCTSTERAQAVDAITPLATSAILAAASADGHLIDTRKLKAAISKANLLSDAGTLLTCATVTASAGPSARCARGGATRARHRRVARGSRGSA